MARLDIYAKDLKEELEKKNYRVEDIYCDTSENLIVLAKELKRHGDTDKEYLRKMCYFKVIIVFGWNVELKDFPFKEFKFKELRGHSEYSYKVDLFDENMNIKNIKIVCEDMERKLDNFTEWVKKDLEEYKRG